MPAAVDALEAPDGTWSTDAHVVAARAILDLRPALDQRGADAATRLILRLDLAGRIDLWSFAVALITAERRGAFDGRLLPAHER